MLLGVRKNICVVYFCPPFVNAHFPVNLPIFLSHRPPTPTDLEQHPEVGDLLSSVVGDLGLSSSIKCIGKVGALCIFLQTTSEDSCMVDEFGEVSTRRPHRLPL